MAFTDYQFYDLEYKGDAISSEALFDNLEVKAEAYINRITFGRVTVPDTNVKLAVCAVCDTLQAHSGHEGIASENNDGYSVNYETGAIQSAIYNAAALFLPADLLYRGLEE